MQYGSFANVYDLFMDDVDYDSWASYIYGFLSGSSKILECGCGTGEIGIRLKKKGLDIVSCDISDDMLEIAANKARNAGVRIPFLHMDMRCLTFPKRFDAVIAVCDAVNYLTDVEEVKQFFHSSFDILKPNGMLLFDISSRYKVESILADNTFSDIRDDAVYVWQNCYDDTNRLLEMNIEFFVKTNNELYRRFNETHIQMAHSENELTELLKETGFSDVKVFDCFTVNDPNEKSQRLQFVCKK